MHFSHTKTWKCFFLFFSFFWKRIFITYLPLPPAIVYGTIIIWLCFTCLLLPFSIFMVFLLLFVVISGAHTSNFIAFLSSVLNNHKMWKKNRNFHSLFLNLFQNNFSGFYYICLEYELRSRRYHLIDNLKFIQNGQRLFVESSKCCVYVYVTWLRWWRRRKNQLSNI